jgi:hypothetical protein
MSLDVEIPDPPPLYGPQSRGDYASVDMADERVEDDYRREEIASFLADGAWQDAFEEWAEETFLTDTEFESILEFGLIEQFDFYWNPNTDDVGYQAPTLTTAQRRELDDDAQDLDAELDSLGRIVTETLENDYLLRDEETVGFFADEYTADEWRK